MQRASCSARTKFTELFESTSAVKTSTMRIIPENISEIFAARLRSRNFPARRPKGPRGALCFSLFVLIAEASGNFVALIAS